MANFQCNNCGQVMDPDVKQVVLPCLHLFCVDCAQKQLESDSTCVQCGGVFSHKTVKGVQVNQDASKLALTLCGQTPETIMQVALNALNCFNKQQDLQGQLRETKLQRRMELLHQQCNEKLQQVHTAYTKAKSKATNLATQLQEVSTDKEELHTKYTQRVSQVKQLKEQLNALQRQSGMGVMNMTQQNAGQMVLAGSNAMNMGANGMSMSMGGGNAMRNSRCNSPSASGGPLGMGGNGGGGNAQMVTTVQRTQFFSMDPNVSPGMTGLNNMGLQGGMDHTAQRRNSPGMTLGNQNRAPNQNNMMVVMGNGGKQGNRNNQVMMMGQGGGNVLQPSNKPNLNSALLNSPSPFL